MFEYFFNGSFLSQHFLAPQYLEWFGYGFLITLWISICTIVASTLLGFAVAAAKDSSIASLRWGVSIYTSIFRNTPLLIQLFFWYFASGEILPSSAMEWLNTPHEIALGPITLAWPSYEFLAGFIGLTLYSVPFIAEELRAGIRGVRRDQKFAAFALGLSGWQAMRYVVLPQAVKIAMPPLLGQYMNIVKNSSLTMAIGVAELSYVSRQVESQTLQTFTAFGLATVLYIVIIACMEGWGQWRQQRMLNKGI
ncbi:amino acid ABC transporter permease [Moellerella wisconsensis]|uniref:Permease component of a glutamate/aspartate transporter n=3 Tax=Moellerella wisconsensis TaxID=158849 RepID=A0A0N0Z900_9GAMM|nr:amino acid ABC transporter permease [Moellerella wisconsensis]KLN98241.1 amino acid ABC transporter permease [Moellerella wisconsensis]KPD03827.1 permease component of a glutamate/aspartate transporter [Moellerella wisconsensis ATCC 35017]UNH24342.1 amino acid ABC transporter permease [Moellerella wisconsensis]UNH27447.1 amino acid ABC transporter permease [Moellerella wisconsensis]UNH30921.1 amino acid ABC transporter permease [Moellerella wisconsensis]